MRNITGITILTLTLIHLINFAFFDDPLSLELVFAFALLVSYKFFGIHERENT